MKKLQLLNNIIKSKESNLLSLLFMLLGHQTNAQYTDRVWCFGDSAGIAFDAVGNATTFSSNAFNRGSNFSVSDSIGNLLIYGGKSLSNNAAIAGLATLIYNSQHLLIQNGDTVAGDPWYQDLTLIPNPNKDSAFLLFSTLTPGSNLLSGLYYSNIDLALNNGLGAIIQKNIPLIVDTMDWSITAVKHGNGRDWWIITHQYNYLPPYSKTFYKFLVTPDSIYGPIIQNIGSRYDGGAVNMVFSKNGEELLCVNPRGLIELLHFNRCTGNFSNVRTVFPEVYPPPTDIRYFGCSFSPSGRYIYVSNEDNAAPSNPYPYVLKQYDLQAANIAASEQIIFSDTLPSSGGLHKLGPDGKIYISMWYQNMSPPYPPGLHNQYTDNLCVINQPDSAGTACNYQPFSFYLGGRRSYLALPNNPNYELGPLTPSNCDTLNLGVEEVLGEATNVSVYPNPATDKITIKYELADGMKMKYIISDVTGKRLLSSEINSTNTIININQLKTGVYFITVFGINKASIHNKITVIR